MLLERQIKNGILTSTTLSWCFNQLFQPFFKIVARIKNGANSSGRFELRVFNTRRVAQRRCRSAKGARRARPRVGRRVALLGCSFAAPVQAPPNVGLRLRELARTLKFKLIPMLHI